MPYTYISGAKIGKFKNDLKLDLSLQSLKPGGWMRGHFELCNDNKIESLGIVVALMGVATVQFGSSRGVIRTQKSRVVVFQAHSFVHNQDVLEKCDTYIKPGHYKFPFTFRLPKNIPSSFVSNYASITYELGAFLRRWGGSCKSARFKYYQINSKPINLENCVNIHSDESLFRPNKLRIPEKKSFSLFSGKKNDLKVKCYLEVAKTGFICCEKLPFTLQIVNPCVLDSVEVSLIRKNVYRAGGIIKTTSQVIASETLQVADKISEEIEWAEKFQLPSDLHPSFKAGHVHCVHSHDVVTLLYTLKAVLHLSDGTSILKGEIPITIGTVNEVSEIEEEYGDNFDEDYSDTWSLAAQSISDLDRSLLPTFSQLSLRPISFGGSHNSLALNQTLPPSYESAMKVGNNTP